MAASMVCQQALPLPSTPPPLCVFALSPTKGPVHGLFGKPLEGREWPLEFLSPFLVVVMA